MLQYMELQRSCKESDTGERLNWTKEVTKQTEFLSSKKIHSEHRLSCAGFYTTNLCSHGHLLEVTRRRCEVRARGQTPAPRPDSGPPPDFKHGFHVYKWLKEVKRRKTVWHVKITRNIHLVSENTPALGQSRPFAGRTWPLPHWASTQEAIDFCPTGTQLPSHEVLSFFLTKKIIH